MAFLMLSSQKSLLTMEKNQLQFQYSCLLNKVQNLKKQEASWAKTQNALYENDGDSETSWDMDNDVFYQALAKEEENLTIDADTINSQIQVIDGYLSSMKTMVQNDVKQATSLNLLGGG